MANEPITNEEFMRQLTELADKEIERVKEFTPQPISEPDLVALAEDMFWGQETALGALLGDLAVNWLIRKLESQMTIVIQEEGV